jgi:hypothetical protein
VPIDPFVADVRREVCAVSCNHKCSAYAEGKINHDDPRTSCPRVGWVLAWGCFGPCDGPTPDVVPRAPVPIVPEPTIAELATNAGFAAWRAAAAIARGERVLVTEPEYRARETACEACGYWDGSSRFGLGKCNHRGCGCTKLKRWLATESCPIGKW